MKKITVFGTMKFSELTGLSPATLMRHHKKGKLVARINKMGDREYIIDDFFNDVVISHMKKRGIDLPISVKQAFVGITDEPEKPTKPVKPATPINKNFMTTAAQMADLPEGVITEYLPPFETLGITGRSIWKLSLKTLIAQQTFKSGDLPMLINYCSVADGLQEMNITLAGESLVDYDGRINPLIAAIDKNTSKMKVLATILHLTPDSRKNIEVKEAPKVDEHTAGWANTLK